MYVYELVTFVFFLFETEVESFGICPFSHGGYCIHSTYFRIEYLLPSIILMNFFYQDGAVFKK